MYGEVPTTSVVPTVVTAGGVAVLPQTGTGFLASVALAVAAGVVVWGVMYYYKVIRAKSVK